MGVRGSMVHPRSQIVDVPVEVGRTGQRKPRPPHHAAKPATAATRWSRPSSPARTGAGATRTGCWSKNRKANYLTSVSTT
jgi:hypothetical protein